MNAHIVHSGEGIESLLDRTSEFQVVAEKEVVCTTTDLVTAFSVLMAIHYTFDFVYAKKARNSLSFIQKVIINMSDETATPPKVVQMMYEINNKLTQLE